MQEQQTCFVLGQETISITLSSLVGREQGTGLGEGGTGENSNTLASLTGRAPGSQVSNELV